MGRNNKNEHLEELLIQKDQEIAALETQVQAYIARTSISQSRLLSTLDALDVIQSGQNNELDAMAQTNNRLKDKLLRYSAVVKTAELEKDDMRDAVLKLVEKVELSNDYSMWPHSQIRLSSLADGPIFPCPIVQTSESDLLLHATTMIEALCRERDSEHKAHAQTRDLAEARLASLAAQLSRREAELESFISGTHSVSAIHPEHPRLAKKLNDEPLTSEQVISALDATLTRNKTLEVEIRGLFKRLEDACLAASSTNLDRPPSGGLQLRNEIQRSLKPITSAISPQISTLQNVQSTSFFGVPEEETVCEHPLARPKGADETLVLPDSCHQAIQDLEGQIKILGAKIDAFTEARRSISQTLRKDVQREDASYSVGTRLEFLESENHLLRLSEQSLRDELDAARISAQTRENELLTEIQSLQSNQQVVFEEANDDYNLLEPDGGEMSMELATPLLPTMAMLDMNIPVSSSAPYFDPTSIPLPPSPGNHPSSSSPTLSQIVLSDGNANHERSDLASIELDHLARALHPP